MRIAFQTKQSNISKELEEKMRQALGQEAFTFTEEKPELVISIGGDGTMLHAFHRYQALLNDLRFVGVHTGHLGFYADWQADEWPTLVQMIKQDAGESVSYPLLHVACYRGGHIEHQELALNESSLRRLEGTMTCEIYLQGQFFELFKGDGLSIATPTGSTGLNKSLGGAVVHPSLNSMQLTEIASINNRVYRSLASSILLSPEEELTVRFKKQERSGTHLFVDHLHEPLGDWDAITFQIAKTRMHFANYRHIPFWRRVRDSFIADTWEVDDA